MSEAPLTQEIDQLLRDLLDGEWDAFKQHRLDEILRDSPEARAQYRQTVQIDAMLETRLARSGGGRSFSPAALSHTPHTVDFRPYLGWAVAAAVAVVALIWTQGPVDPNLSDPNPIASGADPVAKVGRVLDAVWSYDGPRYAVGEDLGPGWILLRSGVAQIDFRDGARLVIEGPARFRVDSASACSIDHGSLTVLAEDEASGFVVNAHGAKIIDLGTEFGARIGKDGTVAVYVFDGKVALAAATDARQELGANESARLEPGKGLAVTPVDPMTFEPIRARALLARQRVRLQLDLGTAAGLYQGVGSPAHAAGDMAPHESFWHGVVGDQTGRVQMADGRVGERTITIDCGAGDSAIDWSAEMAEFRSRGETTHGVFDTALGRDNISVINTRHIGVRIKGLPAGRYRVYAVARPSLHNPNWGNYLTEKAARVSIGVGLDRHGDSATPLVPLSDAEAGAWVVGQTHAVVDVEIGGPADPLTVIASRDREASPDKTGGRSVIQAIQIIQLSDKP